MVSLAFGLSLVSCALLVVGVASALAMFDWLAR